MIKSVNNQDFKIIAVSNRKLCNRPFLEQIERVCKIHPEAVILREKDLTEEEYGTLAKEVMNICRRYQVSCILHNFWKTALELGCTSVHLPLPILQKIADEEKKKFTKIGISIHSVEEAKEAEQLGASYLTAGHIYATDVDHEEAAKTKKRLEEAGFGEDMLTIKLQNFCTIDEIAKEVGGFDFLLADLGVSSMQIDNPKRGFSFKVDGPLDLRLNQETGISAAERLKTITKEELAGMLYENSDEPYAEEIAEAITEKIRKGGKIETTTGLHQVIEETLAFIPEKERKEAVRKSSQRVFQALRIDVNNEFEVLYDFLDKLPGVLKPGGKVAILTFHSGEDRLVKKSFKQWKKEGLYSEIAKDVIRPSKEECFRNSRAKCTKMRWAIRAEE